MKKILSPEAVVQQQLDAYNARDLEAWLETYADEAQQYEYPAKLVANGKAEIRERSRIRFQEPNLHARLIQRSVMENLVIDHEEVTRTFPEGTGTIRLVAIYQVADGKIQSGSFMFGAKSLDKA
ncbi:nuclear transport factor 2 family protein [Undibacterium sp. Jales W-56]|uniref:nuclear transport factor 2 family protein n=1 Tax=Undibacterium sp. Jales W-56 TaxID=2897325 RepID=UPI0021D1F0C5|nr:nuclear transport factor 2 family protein [Undibacterium sp. Jales W-56]MCU6433027.1 nuclear transport factor 2 family protein [Undibacterium sp. Jales W-56]